MSTMILTHAFKTAMERSLVVELRILGSSCMARKKHAAKRNCFGFPSVAIIKQGTFKGNKNKRVQVKFVQINCEEEESESGE